MTEISWDVYPSYSPYRLLRFRKDNLMRGKDVYALQTALNGMLDDDLAEDGLLGKATGNAIMAAQTQLNITVDGLCGGGTQTAICRLMAEQARGKYSLPHLLVFGQISHESSCILGNYSPQRENGSYDAGAAQRNTEHTHPSEGFNVPDSIDALGQNIRQYYDKFAGVSDTRRRWELAAGAWNAPAFACYLAKQEGATGVKTSETARPNAMAHVLFEEYMSDVTAMMEL